jgi:hypothetical protein
VTLRIALPEIRAMTRQPTIRALFTLGAVLCASARPIPVSAQEEVPTVYSRDRGTGVPSSLFGTYLRRGEVVIYPFFEYTRDDNREYQPVEFGAGPAVDFRGRFRGTSTQLFLGYGVTDWLALEFEAAYLTATFNKSPSDPYATPTRLRQTGFGDLEMQVRARLWRESGGRPELFGFVELVARSQRSRVLLDEPHWDAKPGIGLVRGFGFGTMTIRIAAEYNHEERHPDLGEFAVEYLKRVSRAGHLYVGFEGGETGAMDEWDLITGIRWRLAPSLAFKFDNALGLSAKATDWAPQVGLMFTLPR